MQYSPTTRGFYTEAIHGNAIPADVLEITDEQHADLMRGQTEGMVIVPDADGMPVLATPPTPSLAQRKTLLLGHVVELLDSAAQARGYDDIKSAALRAAYPGPYHAEGLAFATWMDAVYEKCYAVLAQFNAGEIDEPSEDELAAMLPALSLPD